MKITTSWCLALSLALLIPTAAHAEGGPGAIDAFRTLDGIITRHQEIADRPDRKLKLRVDALVDAQWFAVEALGGNKHFATRCAKRCGDFSARMSRLVRARVLEHANPRDGATTAYLGETVGKHTTTVHARVTFPKSATHAKQRTVTVDYVMHKAAGQWQVRDIKTDGVGLAHAYREEFTKLYAKGGIDAVFAEIDKTLAKVER